MSRKKLALLFTMACAIGTASVLSISSARAATVVVSPSNMGDWVFNVTDNTGAPGTGSATAQMVNGPATPPLGTGSANFVTSPGNGDESAQLRNNAWAGVKVADLTVLSYSTYAAAFNGSQLPFLNLYLDTDNDNIQDDRLWFEPTYSSAGAGNGNASPQPDVALATWQTWDALGGMWYSDSGLPLVGADPNGPGDHAITLAAYLAAFPDATIVNPSALGGIRLASGFASPGDNYDTNVDAFTIGTEAGSTTYDFEAVPEPTSLALAGIGMLGLVGYAAARRRNLARG